MIGRPFRIDPALSGTVTFVDLLYACLAAFVIVPALTFGLGLLWVALLPETLAAPGSALIGIGFSGMFAWIGAPLALIFGHIAARRGWIGWCIALAAGAAGSLVIGGLTLLIEGAFFSAAFVPLMAAMIAFGTGYAGLFWLALRWLRTDLFR